MEVIYESQRWNANRGLPPSRLISSTSITAPPKPFELRLTQVVGTRRAPPRECLILTHHARPVLRRTLTIFAGVVVIVVFRFVVAFAVAGLKFLNRP
jgi:hypothetical protein